MVGKRDAMPNLKLTKRNVDAFRPGDIPVYVFDTDLPGFFLRVMPSGAKAWGFQFRAGSGRGAPKKRVTIAGFGTLTPEEARAAARLLAADVTKGSDPAEEKAARARETKVSALIDLYEARGCVVQRGKRLGEPMKLLTKAYTLARLRHPRRATARIEEVVGGGARRDRTPRS